MELSSQDSLRLNVMLANAPLAVKINESTMTVHAMSAQGESAINLNPTGRDEQYIKRVKELLSGHVLGSPGGYPIYLQRWTRMGQMRDDSLEQLLLLGEPEAVVAAVTAPGLSDELARRAWWAMEDANNARHMLRKQAVVDGGMGPMLATYLLEHLPFETESDQQIETVRLILQPGLLAADQIDQLWRKADRRPAYYLGFMASLPNDLPVPTENHPLLHGLGEVLATHAAGGNAVAGHLRGVLSASGQAFVVTALRVLEKPNNQDVVNTALDTIAAHHRPVRAGGAVDQTLQSLDDEAADWVQGSAEAAELVAAGIPAELLHALRVLSGVSYGVVRPVFGDSTAIGSLMRRKLAPVLTRLRELLGNLAAAS